MPSLSQTHPDYVDWHPDWVLMRDAYKGERHVKYKGTLYLPATSGMIADGMGNIHQKGQQAYDAYRKRAVFPEFVSEGVETLIGMMHQKPAIIELPERLEPLREQATRRGESLSMLLRKINVEQLITGRLGLLADVAPGQGPDALPYIALYDAESIINWDDGELELERRVLNLVVLDETGVKRTNEFAWESEDQFRVLSLASVEGNETQGTYVFGVFGDYESYSEEGMSPASIAGRTLDEIPFVFVNSKDILPTPDKPPLLPLGRLAMSVYRGEADYRQALFMQGQDTLVVIGGLMQADEEVRIGAGASIKVDKGGDAKFIGVDSQGLAEMRQALQYDKTQAGQVTGKLLDNRAGARESGSALHIRVGSQTATLNQIATVGAGALEKLLKIMARWVGADPDEVAVKPNLDFIDDTITGKDMVELATAKRLGFPISWESLHEYANRRNLTNFTYEEELDRIEAEPEDEIGGGVEGERAAAVQTQTPVDSE